MNWTPFSSITALKSRVEILESQVLDLNMRLSEKAHAEKISASLRKVRQREYSRRHYEKNKAVKATAKEQA